MLLYVKSLSEKLESSLHLFFFQPPEFLQAMREGGMLENAGIVGITGQSTTC